MAYFRKRQQKKQAFTLTETSSKLEKVLKISELSTYQVTFNGVANVPADDSQLLYHVAYKAKVRIGLDMEKITVSLKEAGVNDKKKKIIVALPPVEIADVEVDPGSLDYIFIDSSAIHRMYRLRHCRHVKQMHKRTASQIKCCLNLRGTTQSTRLKH